MDSWGIHLKESALNADGGNILGIVLVETVDVVHHAGSISAGCSDDEEILEGGIVAEVGVFKDDLLQKLDQFIGKLGSHESLDGNRDLIGAL